MVLRKKLLEEVRAFIGTDVIKVFTGVRRGYVVTIGRVKEKEVDFVCQKGADRLYIQVTYLMPTQETREREFGALMSVPDQYDKLVLSMDKFDFSADGIRHRYLPDFLVGSD